MLVSVTMALIPALGLAYILGVPSRIGWRLYSEQWIGTFLALSLAATFLAVATPGARKQGRSTSIPWYDYIGAALALAPGGYLALVYPDMVTTLGQTSLTRVVLATLGIVLVCEALRRLAGWSLVIVVLVFVAYGYASQYLPGVFGTRPRPWTELANYIFVDPNSMLWMLSLGATIGVGFILFGQTLLRFGVGHALTELALYLFGRFRGGPAKSAVVGSSLVGTVTGAPMSNVFLTGSVTIPLMIQTGYSRRVAGATEAVSSTGGQILPPVMGIAGFIIAETLGLPYAEVALAAAVPALLYYVAVFMQIHLEAVKTGLRGLREDEIPALRGTLRAAWTAVFPAGTIVYLIFIERTAPASAAAQATIVALVAFSILVPQGRNLLRTLWSVFEEAGRLTLDIAIVLAAAGIVVGIAGLTGLGFNLSYGLTAVSGDNLFLLLLMAAFVSMILGMGMPSVAAYTMVAVLVAPALTGAGIEPLAAHLFIFYFAVASNITPPIGVSAFAAAPLANAPVMQVMNTSMRLGAIAYLVPFLFVASPALLLQDTPGATAVALGWGVLGTFVLAGGLAGYLHERLGLYRRFAVAAIGILLLLPPLDLSAVMALAKGAGLLALLGMVLVPKLQQRKAASEVPQARLDA